MSAERGIALLLAILVTSFLSAIGLGLALLVVMDRMATGNMRGSIALLYAADAALELAARDLARLGDFNLALAGNAYGSLTDGDPSGLKVIPAGGTVDLTSAAHQLNCGRPSSCSPAQMIAITRERPWGHNNARWRLFAYGPLGNIVQFARPVPGYLAVWIADDGRELDGDPERDSDPGQPGHNVLRARVHAYGPAGTKRAIEAEFARICVDLGQPCLLGIRVQSWQEVRQDVP